MRETYILIAEATVELARQRDMKLKDDHLPETLRFAHIENMLEIMKSMNADAGKFNRFIGWMQAAVVASGIAEMRDFQEINRALLSPDAPHVRKQSVIADTKSRFA